MSPSPDPPVVLQVLPSLITGGVERGTVEIAKAIVEAEAVALVASAGGPMVRQIERAGGTHIALQLTTKSPLGIWRNARALEAVIRRPERVAGACKIAGPGLVGLAGVPAHRCPVRYDLSRDLR